MTDDCYFDAVTKCTALRVKNCEGCTFRKTRAEFLEDAKAAKEMLAAKHLEAYQHGTVISTRPARRRAEVEDVELWHNPDKED